MKLPLLLRILIAIILGVLMGHIVPDVCVRVMNTLNGIFDQLLKFLIPLIIIGLVTPAIADVGHKAGRMLLITVVLAYSFTVFSGLFAYAFSTTLFPRFIHASEVNALTANATEFAPYFTIGIPPLMNVMTALILAFMTGLGIAAFQAPTLRRSFDEYKSIVTKSISTVIIPFLPFYIFGLFLDMTAAGKVGVVLLAFMQIIIIIFAMTLLLLLIQYCIAGLITHRNPFKALANMLPAYATALGTASSAATIPVTLRQVIRNGVDEGIAGFTVPLCATIHLSGSTLKITSCAIALMLMLNKQFDFTLMLGFVLMLGIVMVAAPGVPGGAIMAALGILNSILGFGTAEQAMMITLYITMDSFGTACNVTGDGAIALIVNKYHRVETPHQE